VSKALRGSVGLDEREGLLVRVVEDDSPAAAAGVRQGDLIATVDGAAVANADDLFDALESASKTVTLGLVRGNEDMTVEVSV